MRERLLGHCAVDSGQVIFVDPCYVFRHDHRQNTFGMTSIEVSDHIYDNAEIENLPGNPLAVKLAGFGGDGRYPVTGVFDEKGLLVSARIDFRHIK